MQKLRAKYKEHEMLESEEDDSKSLISSISSASISKHVFQNDKVHNTMFHSLVKKESSGIRSSSSKAEQKVTRQRNVVDKNNKYMKKSGLFVIPEEDQYVDYLKTYKPLNEKFAIRKIVRKDNFRVVPSDQGVYFGQFSD